MFTNRYAFTRSYHRTIHARNRARQRYAIDLSPALLVRIAQAVRDGRATPLGRDVYTVSLPMLDPAFPNVNVIVAFDPWRDEIASILPPDWTVERAEHHDRIHHGIDTATPRPKPSPFCPVEPDLGALTISEAKEWRNTLIDALADSIRKADKAAIQQMLTRINAKIRKLNIRAEKVKVADKVERAKAKVAEDVAKLQANFKETWLDADDYQ